MTKLKKKKKKVIGAGYVGGFKTGQIRFARWILDSKPENVYDWIVVLGVIREVAEGRDTIS